MHLSCGIAETRLCAVGLLARRVRDCTSDSRIASFGLALPDTPVVKRPRPRLRRAGVTRSARMAVCIQLSYLVGR
jgi:hypothetical protein